MLSMRGKGSLLCTGREAYEGIVKSGLNRYSLTRIVSVCGIGFSAVSCNTKAFSLRVFPHRKIKSLFKANVTQRPNSKKAEARETVSLSIFDLDAEITRARLKHWILVLSSRLFVFSEAYLDEDENCFLFNQYEMVCHNVFIEFTA